MNAIQNDDLVAARRSDGLYEIRQVVDGELVMIRLGVYDRPMAEKIAIELAKREQSQAWVQKGPGDYRLLELWNR